MNLAIAFFLGSIIATGLALFSFRWWKMGRFVLERNPEGANSYYDQHGNEWSLLHVKEHYLEDLGSDVVTIEQKKMTRRQLEDQEEWDGP